MRTTSVATALLTPAEEVMLGRRIEAGVLAGRALLHGSPVRATAGELETLVREGRQAWERFLLANTRLVWSVVRQSSGRCGISDDDLFQEGFLALAGALQRYDHTRGRFTTYALPRIQNHLAAVTSARAGTLGLPARRALALRRARAVAMRLEQETGGQAGVAEIAAALGREQEWTRTLLQHRPPLPLEAGGEPVADPIGDLDVRLEHDRLVAGLQRLSEQQRQVVLLRYGFTDGRCRSYRAIAEATGLSPSAARRLEQAAIERLRARSGATRLAG